ncbi:MAG: hypothetical protein E6Q97_16175 [Desulfurellales bacterium]|nr:MAG: hypothetical protein E6Q97_16175 [Desulfurellales bacterium]
MIDATAFLQKATGLAVSSTQQRIILEKSEYAQYHSVNVKINNASSLVGGIVKLEAFTDRIDDWTSTYQIVALMSTTTAPTIVWYQTSNATGLAGGAGKNLVGITALTTNDRLLFEKPGTGQRIALTFVATSGTATLDFAYVGKRYP